MKTAVSVPDDSFALVDRLALRSRRSRSEMWARQDLHWITDLEALRTLAAKTTQVDIGDVIEDKLDALKEHVTQIAPTFFFVAFTPDEWRQFQPTEDFTLKVSYVAPVRIPEDDLFAGIDLSLSSSAGVGQWLQPPGPDPEVTSQASPTATIRIGDDEVVISSRESDRGERGDSGVGDLGRGEADGHRGPRGKGRA